VNLHGEPSNLSRGPQVILIKFILYEIRVIEGANYFGRAPVFFPRKGHGFLPQRKGHDFFRLSFQGCGPMTC
jgi:hypothetical protein